MKHEDDEEILREMLQMKPFRFKQLIDSELNLDGMFVVY